MDEAGGVPQDQLAAEKSETSKEAKERNALEERDVSESGCPSCGAPAPCSTWLKITLGFTAAKAVARLDPKNSHGVSILSDQVTPSACPRPVSTKESSASRLLLPCHRFLIYQSLICCDSIFN